MVVANTAKQKAWGDGASPKLQAQGTAQEQDSLSVPMMCHAGAFSGDAVAVPAPSTTNSPQMAAIRIVSSLNGMDCLTGITNKRAQRVPDSYHHSRSLVVIQVV